MADWELKKEESGMFAGVLARKVNYSSIAESRELAGVRHLHFCRFHCACWSFSKLRNSHANCQLSKFWLPEPSHIHEIAPPCPCFFIFPGKKAIRNTCSKETPLLRPCQENPNQTLCSHSRPRKASGLYSFRLYMSSWGQRCWENAKMFLYQNWLQEVMARVIEPEFLALVSHFCAWFLFHGFLEVVFPDWGRRKLGCRDGVSKSQRLERHEGTL